MPERPLAATIKQRRSHRVNRFLSVSAAMAISFILTAFHAGAQSLVRVETGANEAESLYGATGSGVTIAVLDRGINYTNPDFRNPDGSTRIRWMLDMTGSNWCNAGNPSLVEYSEAEINAALSGGTPLAMRDAVGHGDSTAGLAAGNGRSLAGNLYRGMAPEADLIILKVTSEGAPAHGSEAAEPFFNGCLDDAFDWLAQKMDSVGQPAVAILNSGTQWGPIDGTGAVSRKIDEVFGEHNPGRIMVIPAGDEGSLPSHSRVAYDSAGDASVTFVRNSANFAQISAWTTGSAPVDVTVVLDDDATTIGPIGPGSSASQNGVTVIHYLPGQEFYPWTSDGGDRAIWIGITGHPGSTGEVRFRATAAGTSGIADVYSDVLGPNLTVINELTSNLTAGRLTDYASTRTAIVAGNSNIRTHWTDIDSVPRSVTSEGAIGDLWLKSPAGPTRDGRPYGVDITTPGQGSFATLSPTSYWSQFRGVIPLEGAGTLIRFGGTSASAPILTGAVALMLQFNPNLTTAQAREILHQTARSDAFTGGVPSLGWGYGKLDAAAAVEGAKNLIFSDGFEQGAVDAWQ